MSFFTSISNSFGPGSIVAATTVSVPPAVAIGTITQISYLNTDQLLVYRMLKTLAGGYVYLVTTNVSPYVARLIFTDANHTYSKTVTVTYTGYGGCGSMIEEPGTGALYISFYQGSTSSNYQLKIAKFNSTGTVQWQRGLAFAAFVGSSTGLGLVRDAANNYIVSTNRANTSNCEAGFAKYTSSGALSFQCVLSKTPGNTNIQAIAVDSQSSIYAAGYWSSSTAGDYRIYGFVAKFPATGGATPTWQRWVYSTGSTSSTAAICYFHSVTTVGISDAWAGGYETMYSNQTYNGYRPILARFTGTTGQTVLSAALGPTSAGHRFLWFRHLVYVNSLTLVYAIGDYILNDTSTNKMGMFIASYATTAGALNLNSIVGIRRQGDFSVNSSSMQVSGSQLIITCGGGLTLEIPIDLASISASQPFTATSDVDSITLYAETNLNTGATSTPYASTNAASTFTVATSGLTGSTPTFTVSSSTSDTLPSTKTGTIYA